MKTRALIVRFTLDAEQKAMLTRYTRRHYGHSRIRDILREQGIHALYSARDDESEREKQAELVAARKERDATWADTP